MMELNQLSKAIASSASPDKEGNVWWSLHRHTSEEDWLRLPSTLRAEVKELSNEIGKLVPDDVDFTMFFENKGTSLSLEYSDGVTGSFGPGVAIKTRGELFAALQEVDWDAFRSASLQQLDVFDDIKDDAEDRPINIPSSEEAAGKWAKPLVKALAEARKQSGEAPFVVIYGRGRERLEVRAAKSRKDMLGDMADALTTQYHVLAILEVGRELDFPVIESIKREAIELLTPGSISRAMAEGRF